jgi:hypothetical protein
MQTCSALRAALALALVVPGASAQDLVKNKVEVEHDESADFTRYRTFAWTPFQTPAANPAVHIRLTEAIERELQAHGLEKAENATTADLFVQYEARLEKKVRGTPTRSDDYWQPSNTRFIVNFDRVEVGTLVIQLWDGKTKDVVWSAKGIAIMGREDQRARQADDAVKQMLAGYPPKAAEAPAAKP